MQTMSRPRVFPLPSLDALQHQVTRHVLRDGTHEIRAGLIAMIPTGLWLARLNGLPSYDSGVGIGVALLIGLAAGPGVTRLRSRYVIPRLGYARHTRKTDLAALAAVAIVLACVGMAWLEERGSIGWGRVAAAVAIPAALLVLARESTLGRHYLVAVLVSMVGALLLFGHLTPFHTLSALLLAASALLTLGGVAALRSLVVNHPEAGSTPGANDPR
jgi:hypothetical protein